MAKLQSKYICQSCGYQAVRPAGKCPNCNAWNSFVEELSSRKETSRKSAVIRGAAAPVPITEVDVLREPTIATSFPELNRVLGGGIVPGSLVLVGGDPGIGKSTLMLQMASALKDHVVLYLTGEESPAQIKLRAERLETKPSKNLLILAETDIDLINVIIEKTPPDILIVDSIQTMYRSALESAPGTISQMREACALFMRIAKSRGIPVFLVGHVTKEGVIAGPKVIEHMVDAVLQFEGERHYAYRILRAQKNRFGSTNEIGIFEMYDGGLREVVNPSQVFLAERKPGATGSTVVASMEGTRPLLIEVQALVAPTSYGVPQRTTTGYDAKRLQMILAVLERRAGIQMGMYDVFVNIAGGMRVEEPAVDLGTAISIVSSLRNKPTHPQSVAFGEIGLGGEIRSIHQIDKRISEAAKLGFKRVVLPRQRNNNHAVPAGITPVEVDTIEDAITELITT